MYLADGTLLQGGKYKIVRHLSSGGFGNTYEGYDVSLDRRVAIKEFFVKGFCDRRDGTTAVTITVPSKRDLILHLKQKFVMEARAIAKMEHENIVRVQNLFEENSTAYYVMDYIEGESVEAILRRRGSLPDFEALPIIRKVADALGYMHRRDSFHLDIKPANIMVRRDGKVILIDFGSSKQYAEVDGEDTTTFAPCYTPGYAPPEQMNPSHTKFTAATDVYALGATLYKMLTGQKPPTSIMLMMGEAELLPLPSATPKGVKACVQQAITPLRTKRLQSIEEFLRIIDKGGDAEATILADDGESTKLVNDGEALLKLARRHMLSNQGVKQDLAKAAELLLQAADNGNTDALWELGRLYEDGLGVKIDKELAFKLYTQAAKKGNAIGFYHLGYCYENGVGTAKDKSKSDDCYKNAFSKLREKSREGDVYAQTYLGDCYRGRGVTRDKSESLKWYTKAADQGLAEAQFHLGRSYLPFPPTVKRENNIKAVMWYRKAAEQGHVLAQYELGRYYYIGRGVAKDYTESMKWWRKAAEQGYVQAQYKLGDCYYEGNVVPQDYTEAAKWYRKAAEQGHTQAQFNIGICYGYGKGVPQDKDEAARWFRRFAEQSNDMEKYRLGIRFYKGEGVPRDYDEAVKWTRKAAEHGNAYAQTNLGWFYEKGECVQQDYTEAMKWYRRAAEHAIADDEALKKLGDCYYEGKGVPQDYVEAVKWYHKAATHLNGSAMLSLGICYENGKGVPQDCAEAQKWYNKAAERGCYCFKTT